MKALGYGNFSIASKDLGYAFLATAGGSILGVLTGEKILPYIIIYAYEIMYPHIPKIYVPYHMSYAVMASAASIVCTMGATLASCYKELAAEPAVLMRPPAPKKGRRVFLERIGFIWKRMNFTWKSTIRNLMRYKKRFFMTIFGIGGCMALMLVGYGVKDSVYEIADIQYDEIQLYDGHIFYKDDVTKTEKEELKEYLKEDTINYTISFNGKARFNMEFDADAASDAIQAAVLADERSQKWIEGKTPKKIIVVPKKIVNVVV